MYVQLSVSMKHEVSLTGLNNNWSRKVTTNGSIYILGLIKENN